MNIRGMCGSIAFQKHLRLSGWRMAYPSFIVFRATSRWNYRVCRPPQLAASFITGSAGRDRSPRPLCLPPQASGVRGQPLAVALSMRSAPALHDVPPWAPEEDERALSGASVAEMAKQMKRSAEAVRSRAYRLKIVVANSRNKRLRLKAKGK